MKVTLRKPLTSAKFSVVFPANIELNATRTEGEFTLQHPKHTGVWIGRIKLNKIKSIQL